LGPNSVQTALRASPKHPWGHRPVLRREDRLRIQAGQQFELNGERQEVRSAGLDELWRVFVLLRGRPGVYGCTVRASGPLAAEETVAARNQSTVLETLGSESLGRGLVAVEAEYRRFHVAGSRRVSGRGALSGRPLLEVMATEGLGHWPDTK
jgi:hypothetical protein